MFENRFDAAHQLVPYLSKYKNNPQALILAIPRGGLELGSVLAKQLHLPLDIILSKKIGLPGNQEYAIGSVNLSHVFLNPDFDRPELKHYLAEEIDKIRSLLSQRSKQYRGDKAPLDLKDKIVIVVDDGVATGNTLLATLALIKQSKPKKIIIALPVAPSETLKKLKPEVDEIICLLSPELFFSVGQFYKKFNQVNNEQAIALLQEAQS